MKLFGIRPLFVLIMIVGGLAALLNFADINGRHNAFAAADDKYKALDTFGQALGIVENGYVEPLKQQEIIYGAIKGMLQDLDPHSTFYTPEEYQSFKVDTKGSFGGLGITISLKDEMITIISPMEDTPAAKAGIKAGDVILMINNEPAMGMSLETAVSKMRGEAGSKIKLTISRKGETKPLDFTMERAIIKIKSVKSAMVDNIGYARLTQFQENSSNEMTKALEAFDKAGAEGIIIDLRNNGGGLLSEAINVSSLFLPTDKSVVFTKDRNSEETHYKTKKISYRDNKRPIVVLVNEGSASASEILAGALQDYKRALIVGSVTFGKASVQSIIEMKDGSAIKLTTARYYTPLGRSIQGVGIVPDVPVGAGKIEFTENPYVIKESDLSKHLLGENEKAKSKDKKATADKEGVEVILPPAEDLQYRSALQILQGMMVYAKADK